MEALDKTQILALLGAARAARERDFLMILVAFWHGLRASEVVALTPDNFKDGRITVKRLKGSLKTSQPLVEDENPLLDEKKALFDFMRGLKGNQRLFPVTRQTFWNIMQRHGTTSLIEERHRHPHVLKTSIALQTIKDAGIENVRQYLGHKSISSTGAYLKVSDADASSAISRAARGR